MAHRLALPFMAIGVAVALAACGNEIGDACFRSVDCSPEGDRLCDPSSFEGYCTIRGCDFSTCPDEAVCVRFFTGGFANLTCTDDASCGSPDERCSLAGRCVSVASEVRYCMRTCDSDGDCRNGYECRDLQDMKDHGGEPMLAPGETIGDDPPKFCAEAP